MHDLNSKFIGAWELQSCKLEAEDGTIIYPYGEKPKGHLIYSENKMAVTLMNSERTQFQDDEYINGATQEERLDAYNTFDAYSGNYEINSDKQIITHKIQAGKIPNWVDDDHPRYFEFKDDYLILKTDAFHIDGKDMYASLVWQKTEQLS